MDALLNNKTGLFPQKEVDSMDPKTQGWIQLIGGLIAGWFGWQAQDYGVLVLAVVALVMSAHHLGGKKGRR